MGMNQEGFSTGKGGEDGKVEHMPDTTVHDNQSEADAAAKEAKSGNQSDSGSGPMGSGGKY